MLTTNMKVLLIFAIAVAVTAAQRTCHGDINNLHPSGKANGGVAASEADVAYDVPALERHRNCYQASADRNCIQASVLAAIASRESRGGTLLVATGGWGDFGNAWGIMQCDVRYSGLPCTSVPWDSCEHVEMLVNRLLVPYVNQVHNKFPGWSMDQALQGAVAGYNGGVSRVTSWDNVDGGTTGHDYSNDVIARAKYLIARGWN